MKNDLLVKRDYIHQLFDIYGSLLTLKQQQLIRWYYGEDLSLSEIALSENISRTAVSDALKQSVAKMMGFEHHLQLLKQQEMIITWFQSLPLLPAEKKQALMHLRRILKQRCSKNG